MSNRENTVFFTGHRCLSRDFDEKLLENAVRMLIKRGCDTFICGGALGFDTMAANTVLAMKEIYPHIRLHLYLPCRDQDIKWSAADRAEYRRILSLADHINMPERAYYDGCMRERNYKMADSSAYCICYLTGWGKSGTAQTVRYAMKRNIPIYNVARAVSSLQSDE